MIYLFGVCPSLSEFYNVAFCLQIYTSHLKLYETKSNKAFPSYVRMSYTHRHEIWKRRGSCIRLLRGRFMSRDIYKMSRVHFQFYTKGRLQLILFVYFWNLIWKSIFTFLKFNTSRNNIESLANYCQNNRLFVFSIPIEIYTCLTKALFK